MQKVSLLLGGNSSLVRGRSGTTSVSAGPGAAERAAEYWRVRILSKPYGSHWSLRSKTQKEEPLWPGPTLLPRAVCPGLVACHLSFPWELVTFQSASQRSWAQGHGEASLKGMWGRGARCKAPVNAVFGSGQAWDRQKARGRVEGYLRDPVGSVHSINWLQ